MYLLLTKFPNLDQGKCSRLNSKHHQIARLQVGRLPAGSGLDGKGFEKFLEVCHKKSSLIKNAHFYFLKKVLKGFPWSSSNNWTFNVNDDDSKNKTKD